MRVETADAGQRAQVNAPVFRFTAYDSCQLCPRRCGANRTVGKIGFCGMDARIFAARAALHFWEEPCISGSTGSGAVFFSGCSLGCVYCQNYGIAHGQVGKEITVPRLAEIFLELQEKGAANINLVTPTHYAPSILEALKLARKDGLAIPTVYNCSGYESVEALKMLDGWIDVYLADFKYLDPELARRYSHAADYPERAKEALSEMARQQGNPVFDENGMMKRGVIVRHLLLPGHVKNAKAVVKYVYETYGGRVWLSLMNQYTPMEAAVVCPSGPHQSSPAGNRPPEPHQARPSRNSPSEPRQDSPSRNSPPEPRPGRLSADRFRDFPELTRRVTRREYESLLKYAMELGVENAYFQEGETAKESFIPSFDYEGL